MHLTVSGVLPGKSGIYHDTAACLGEERPSSASLPHPSFPWCCPKCFKKGVAALEQKLLRPTPATKKQVEELDKKVVEQMQQVARDYRHSALAGVLDFPEEDYGLIKKYAKRVDFFNVEPGSELHEAADRIPCLLYTSPSPRDKRQSRMPSSA